MLRLDKSVAVLQLCSSGFVPGELYFFPKFEDKEKLLPNTYQRFCSVYYLEIFYMSCK